MGQPNYPCPKYHSYHLYPHPSQPIPDQPVTMPMPVPIQHQQGQFMPNLPIMIPTTSNPLHPQHIIFQSTISPQLARPQQTIGYRQQISIGMYQRHHPNENNDFMCLRRNVQFKRELDAEEEQNKVVIKEYPRQTTSYSGPYIVMILVNLPSKVFNTLSTALNSVAAIDTLMQYKDEHWIVKFIGEVWDRVDWGSVVKKIVPVKFADVGKGDECNRILVRSDRVNNCCLPFELARQISSSSLLNTSTAFSIFGDKNASSSVCCYETCAVSSPNFDFIISLTGQSKLNTQKCLIDCVEFGGLGFCSICRSNQIQQEKISMTLENWVGKDRFGLVLRCTSLQMPDLLGKISKHLYYI
ncbi:hypothetical protein BmR1_04g09919 [Babesia microti strain RI]|uniref:Uncharacterized protein n=1 Tax=Babesia microti (strain RI) TaxID=1133968 RepID=A0A1N6LYI3_BABMR|nr:hypothetical protein BmR1_04g09919 [Babesia microti strain RI]SIO73933.1 hypothetical protein BmR1_04g09919 [Babesia microti strain RI]|eukprot:XP_021337978.1 hypothetical protein BmR1_04g09919 [Babesia microti strain RI]